MTNLGLQTHPKSQFGSAWLNLNISQENFVEFAHHAYFYKVLGLSRFKNNFEKSELGIHKLLDF